MEARTVPGGFAVEASPGKPKGHAGSLAQKGRALRHRSGLLLPGFTHRPGFALGIPDAADRLKAR